MKWFGPHVFSHAAEAVERIDTPTVPCAWCDERFTADDCGYGIPYCEFGRPELYYHVECFQRQTLGSVAHIERRCHCYGGHDGDPPELSKREGAILAVEAWRRQLQRDTDAAHRAVEDT